MCHVTCFSFIFLILLLTTNLIIIIIAIMYKPCSTRRALPLENAGSEGAKCHIPPDIIIIIIIV
jgi:hypothetical protein